MYLLCEDLVNDDLHPGRVNVTCVLPFQLHWLRRCVNAVCAEAAMPRRALRVVGMAADILPDGPGNLAIASVRSDTGLRRQRTKRQASYSMSPSVPSDSST